MKGWLIVKHALRQVFGNLSGALRVSAALYLVQVVVGFLLGASMMRAAGDGTMGMGTGLQGLVVLVVVVVTGLWIAVAWHRFVLLGEAPGPIPRFPGAPLWAYLLRSVVYGVMMIAVGGLWGAVVGFALAPVLMGNMVGWTLAMALFVYLPVMVVLFRLTTDLPGAALGVQQPFLSGWRATAGQTGDIAVLAAILIAFSTAAELLGMMIFGRIPVVNLVWGLVISWLQMMIGASVLTTLSGHYVEKRALV
jgi:hypothetical protein